MYDYMYEIPMNAVYSSFVSIHLVWTDKLGVWLHVLGSGQSRQNVILCILSGHRPYDTVQYCLYFITSYYYYKLLIEVEEHFITVQHSRDNFVISRTF